MASSVIKASTGNTNIQENNMAFTKDVWWHVDKQGRRIGWLWPEDLISICESLYGEKWMERVSADFGQSISTTIRWKKGHMPVPRLAAFAIHALNQLQAKGITVPDMTASWLPVGTGANARQPEVAADAA
jgi:hypothetical protein